MSRGRAIKRWTSGRCQAIARGLRRLGHDRRGTMMLEAVVGVLVFSLIGTATLSGLSTAQFTRTATERQSQVENIARNEMEYFFSLPYQNPPGPCPTIAVPQDYSVGCVTEEAIAGDPSIAKVVVTVTHLGQEKLILETIRRQ